MLKNPSAMQEIWVESLGREDPLEEGMATYSSILAWRIQARTGQRRLAEGQRRLTGYSPWGHSESDMTEAPWHTLASTCL